VLPRPKGELPIRASSRTNAIYKRLVMKVGVIGAGVMGTGVAQALATAHHSVVLLDVHQSLLSRAKAALRSSIRLQRLLKPAHSPGMDLVQRIEFTCDWKALSGAEYVIENVPEKWHVKETVYQQLETECPPACIFAANTSCIPITRVASATQRPDRVIGIHFMNPVPLKCTVELIRGMHTSDRTVTSTLDLLRSMGKEAILVQDSPGFVSNRVLMLMINEAIFLLSERVADAETVDRVFTDCFGHPMGPLRTADLIGLETILYSLEMLLEMFGDPKFRPCPLLRQMVSAGWLGSKTGKGFFSYEDGMPVAGQAAVALQTERAV
jgi:3-hydroxybutyryl-CoA dehydrogenase